MLVYIKNCSIQRKEYETALNPFFIEDKIYHTTDNSKLKQYYSMEYCLN